MIPYIQRLHSAIQKKQTAALVGLDPRWEQLPETIRSSALDKHGDSMIGRASAYEEFCLRIIDVVAPLVPAVKPQSAFFEECGPEGVQALRNVIRAARDAGLIVICDAKRGDIGSTAQAYANAYLAGEDPSSAPFAADALTVNPYMGVDTLQPFVQRASEVGGGLYVLVRTSNPGAGDFQDRTTEGSTLFEAVADGVERLSSEFANGAEYGSIGAVVGATFPKELEELRARMKHVPLLVPGYGSQGGTSKDVASAFDSNGLGAVINSSRGIIFSYRKSPLAEEFGEARWEEAVESAAKLMIADLAEHTPVGNLKSS
ncbi:orotidine 5'-phosphate decarboxylase [Thalassoglobus neptunius]|uniref:Orotidine 5'-phosphate decarboxylase n=1 Tax=Thalassoglobus neptunius TaxID=1938619 RepID=A0A5C5WWY7_9PLAN|nr:orotidine-5'-phosphate decarboxylase [Thalassoglobus neptunius]TWT55464.1 orotidine 5'-phosphate decarboxylase [Thalassoglobus neptunius]